MPGRFGPLKRGAAALLSLVLLLATVGTVHAHRLEAEYHVLPGQKVQVESWFDTTGDSPKGAKVEVFGPDQQLRTSGRLDEEGIFIFSFSQPEPLTVVVSAGAGHRKELLIPRTELLPSTLRESGDEAVSAVTSPDETPRADRSSRVTIKDILIGVSFLLSLAAFILSIRNARQLRGGNDDRSMKV